MYYWPFYLFMSFVYCFSFLFLSHIFCLLSQYLQKSVKLQNKTFHQNKNFLVPPVPSVPVFSSPALHPRLWSLHPRPWWSEHLVKGGWSDKGRINGLDRPKYTNTETKKYESHARQTALLATRRRNILNLYEEMPG